MNTQQEQAQIREIQNDVKELIRNGDWFAIVNNNEKVEYLKANPYTISATVLDEIDRLRK